MRLPHPSLLVNSALAAALIGGGAWAYVAVANPAASEATTGDQTVVTAAQGTVTATVSASGTVESASTASASFGTSGTVTEIRVAVGDEVEQGQVLATVDDAAAKRQLDSAQATLDAAEDALDRAEEADGDTADAESQVSQAELDLAEAEDAVAGTTLKAPMAGTVIAVNGDLGGSSGGSPTDDSPDTGDQATPDDSSSDDTSSGFIEIADLSELEISASVAEADATRLETGQTATITWNALPDTAVTGELVAVDPNPTTSNEVVSYGVTFGMGEIPDGARLGQTVEVSVTVGQVDNAVYVNSAAVTSVGELHTVTILAGGVTETRTVEIGLEGDLFTEITAGLTAGEQVVVTAADTGDDGGFPFPGGGGGFPGGGFQGGGGGPPGGGGGPGGGG